jgi:hypothetical protein
MSMSLASTRRFFQHRRGIYSDANPPFKLSIFVLPLIMIITIGIGIIWKILIFYTSFYAIICLLVNWILIAVIEVIFYFNCKIEGSNEKESNNSENRNMLLTKVFSSWIFPVFVSSDQEDKKLLKIFLTSTCTFIWPLIFCLLFRGFEDVIFRSQRLLYKTT